MERLPPMRRLSPGGRESSAFGTFHGGRPVQKQRAPLGLFLRLSRNFKMITQVLPSTADESMYILVFGLVSRDEFFLLNTLTNRYVRCVSTGLSGLGDNQMDNQAESMKKQIESFIDDLKSNKKITSFDEAATKQAVVLRLLSHLGWDIFNVEDVYPDYSANSVTISYALRVKNTNKVFIEVKRINEKLDNHQQEFVNFSSREGVDMAVLTNGIAWWFYLISAKGSWQQKWFYSIDLLKQKPDAFIPQLSDLLTNNKIARGQFIKTAKALYQSKRQKMAAEFLPEAWNQIISQPSKIFVELLSEHTEKLCGFKVDSKAIEKFLEKHLDKWLLKNMPSSAAIPPAAFMESEILDLDLDEELDSPSDEPSPVPQLNKPESYGDKMIASFAFNGQTYPVHHWEEVLTTLCNHFATLRTKDFEKVLWLSNDQKPYFSRYSDQLRIPEKIKHTDIYVETKLKPDEIVKAAVKLLTEFGHSREELIINTQ
jgi:hypothetical protein